MSRRTRASSIPSTDELRIWGAPVELRDGSHVRLRPGRSSEDRELLLRGFERLSPESRYRRFLMPTPELSPDMVRYLTDVDHHDHEAIIATDEANREGLGVARYVRNPNRPDSAEVAVTVIDDWQGRGLGTLLLEMLSARARQEGIRSFTALMLATNEPMMDLLRHLDGDVEITHRDTGTVEIEMPIPDVGLAPALRKLLRISAHTDVVLSPAARSPARLSGPGSS
jgi:GNAT superfamily N-acetyltransferase